MSAKREIPMTESPPTTPPRMGPRWLDEDESEPESMAEELPLLGM